MMKTDWHTIPFATRSPMLEWRISSLEACPHGLEIIFVDGTYVRNHYDSDFSQGGNGYRYDFIPKSEIWIDWQISEDERLFIAFHECHESMLMKRGWSYSRAHDKAKQLEDQHRHAALTERASLPRRLVMAAIILGIAKYLENPDLPAISDMETPDRLASFMRTDADLLTHPGQIPEKKYVVGDLQLVVKYLSHPDVKSRERQETPFPLQLPSSSFLHDLREILRDLS
jgi:hypothetical protein